MTLQVSFDQFAETVKRLLSQEEAYVTPHSAGTLATAGVPERSIVVASLTPVTPDVASSTLAAQGFVVRHGSWLIPEDVLSPVAAAPAYVAAVSYRSAGDKPGVWVDAYPALPTQVAVLRHMYEEFRQTGEVEDVPFEDFVELANPNVVIVSPSELDSFIRQKEEC